MSKIQIKDGLRFFPETKKFKKEDLFLVNNKITTKSNYENERNSSTIVIDARDLIVSPGLIDLHTHVFRGQDLGINADDYCLPYGVTTVLDAGSAGSHIFPAFNDYVIKNSKVTIFALLNISSIGTTSIMLKGELIDEYCNTEEAKKTFLNYKKVIKGIKVRASHNVGGKFTVEALRRARKLSDELKVPLMVHLGPAPAYVEEILDLLKAGDILTHAFTGWDNSLTKKSQIKDSTFLALKKGVLFDVGHGMGGFDSEVAKTLLEANIFPNTISTDIHSYSISESRNLPFVMSKFWALGMPLEDIFYATTLAPAKAIGINSLGFGNLKQGKIADVAIFKTKKKRVEFSDCHNHTFTGSGIIEPVATIKSGEIVAGSKDFYNKRILT